MAELAAVETAPTVDTTPQGGAPANDAQEQAPKRLSINELLGSTSYIPVDEESQEQAPEAAPEGEAEPEAETQEAKPSGDPFDPEALKTPEGIAKARDVIKNRSAKVTRREMAAERREQKLTHRVNEFKQAQEQTTLVQQALVADIGALRRGDARSALTALGRLAGRDPVEFLTDVNRLLVNNGPLPEAQRGKPSPEVQALLERTQQLEGYLQQQQEAERQRALQYEAQEIQTANHQYRERMIEGVLASSESYPALAEYAASNRETVHEAIHHVKLQHYNETGQDLSDQECLYALDQEIAALRGPSRASTREAGQVTSAQPPNDGGANPGNGRGARPPIAKTISPGLATQSSGHGSTQEMSDSEHTEWLLKSGFAKELPFYRPQ